MKAQPRPVPGPGGTVHVPVATVWTDPTAPRDVDTPAVQDLPDLRAWTGTMGAQDRRGLLGRVATQVLLGERVQVLEERGPWLHVACPEQPSSGHSDGYPGWVRRVHVASSETTRSGPMARVTARSAWCRTEGAGPVELSFGTALPAIGGTRHCVEVLLPDGRHAMMDIQDVSVSARPEPQAMTAEHALAAARQFVGLRYLWGGTSSWGLDCSGLVHLTYRSLGVVVPRDASDQERAADVESVPLDQVRPGDLYFFAHPGEEVHHVGFVTRVDRGDREDDGGHVGGTRWMLHAPETGGRIEETRMHPDRVSTLVAAGRLRVFQDMTA